MIGLDTNVVLRWLLYDLFEDVSDRPEELDEMVDRVDRVFLNHVVIAETIWVLRNKIGKSKPAVTQTMERLTSTANVVVDRPKTVAGALESFAKYPGGFTDHLIGQINRDAGCTTTWTFDKAALKSPEFTKVSRR